MAKFKQIKQNSLNSPTYSVNCAKFAPIINLFILCFRGLPQQRTLGNSSELRKFHAIRPHSPQITQIPRNSPTQSTNYAKFAPFVNVLDIMFQAPAPAENPQEFQQITQIPRSSPTQSTNYAKFAPFVNLLDIVSGTCPGREPSGIPANYANSVQFAHIVREPHEIGQIC